MPKARINKLIFQEGKVFLRIKTTARHLKLKREGFDYTIEFQAKDSENSMISMPIVFVQSFGFSDSIYADAIDLGYKKSEFENLPDAGVVSEIYTWGQVINLKAATQLPQCYYYLVPTNQKFAVRIGPFAAGIETSDIEIDWPNIQWGME